jgi:hypothetical protein
MAAGSRCPIADAPSSPRPELAALKIADSPERWAALGFTVTGKAVTLGGVTIELGAGGSGIVSWRLRGVAPTEGIDGLATEIESADRPAPTQAHPNGAVGLDHLVVLTPQFDRTTSVLADAGLQLRRIREAPGGVRQGFRRLGPVILEVVETPGRSDGPARFWGLVVTVPDLDAVAARLGDRLGAIKPAVQTGRRIATLRESAGLSVAVAFMST